MSNLLIARDLLSENGKKNRGHEKNYENNESGNVKIRTVRSTDSFTLSEGIKSNPRKSYSYSRLTTRRFTSAHTIGIRNLQSSDLGGVNSSAVISAWGLSRPRVDFLATNGDIHREFNADLLNLIPTDGSFAKRVSYCDAFIEDGHLGADKAEMKEVADQQRPTQGHVKAVESFYEETLRREASTEKIDARGEEVTTSSSVDLRISHANILSRKVVR
jgi:hypothetical protein